jgi:pimeloyl-ACP methyl ester carboxylesterase
VEAQYREVGRGIPIKIIWGADDTWIPVESAWRLEHALDAKEVVVIEKAGHLSMLDQPAQFGVELGRWLGAFERS